MYATAFRTPMGTLIATASEDGLTTVGFDLDRLAEADQSPTPALDAFGAWLDLYLARRFDDLPEVPRAAEGTAWERRVWEAISEIRPGRTASYGDLARDLGKPTGARAVGAAAGRNPLLLLVPCHRLVGASGALTGFGAGTDRKAWLLRHEGVLLL